MRTGAVVVSRIFTKSWGEERVSFFWMDGCCWYGEFRSFFVKREGGNVPLRPVRGSI